MKLSQSFRIINPKNNNISLLLRRMCKGCKTSNNPLVIPRLFSFLFSSYDVCTTTNSYMKVKSTFDDVITKTHGA